MTPALTPSAWLRWELIKWILRMEAGVESVLEVGCGQGAMAWRLARLYDYRGYEPDIESYEAAARRLRNLGRGAVYNSEVPDRPDRSFDALAAFEVLEHVRDDAKVLKRWNEWIRPKGLVVISVPAHADRFGASDRAVGHYRRYGRDDCSILLQRAGVHPTAILSYGFPLGHAGEFVRNRVASGTKGEASGRRGMAARTASSGRWLQPPPWVGPVVAAAVYPFRKLQKPFVNTSLGTGFVAWGRKMP